MKATIFSILFFQSILNNNPIVLTIFVSIVGFWLPDYLIYLYEKKMYKEIKKDFYNIIDNVYIQFSINMPISMIFEDIYDSCKNKNLKKAIAQMLNVYEYTGYNMGIATLELTKKFDIMECDMFCNALVEQVNLGENLALFENLSNILKEKNIEQIKNETKKCVALITFGVVVTLINIFLMVFYPILNSFTQSFTNIFV